MQETDPHPAPSRQRLRLAILGRNKYELWVSMLVLWCGIGLDMTTPGFAQDIAATGALVVAVVCTINALCDMRRMHPVERCVALLWALCLVLLTGSFVTAYAGALTGTSQPLRLPWAARENR